MGGQPISGPLDKRLKAVKIRPISGACRVNGNDDRGLEVMVLFQPCFENIDAFGRERGYHSKERDRAKR